MKSFTSRLRRNVHRFLFATLAITLLIPALYAQPATATQQSSEDRVALYQALLDLQNPWTVMCVAAHPDDEDGTSLMVMRRKYGAHTVSLFSTFGEGGQNAIGPELYEELGAIRARETMAAAEIQGSEPHFLGLKDFGYSKTRDEAFKFWGHEEGLRRMVLEIRKLRPDVIITNHSTTSNDHGQHQATALMVVEAFDAAADPNKFPEQLKDGVTTWQVQRLFVRARGNAAPAADAQIVTIDPNEKDPVRGVVYAEEALRALQQHATQGPWPKTFVEFTARFRAFSGQSGQPGQMPLIRYALVRSANGAAPLSAKESHNFLDGMSLPEDVARQLAPPTINSGPLTNFVDEREKVFATLLAAAKENIFGKPFHNVQGVLAEKRRAGMMVKLNNALVAASGLSAHLSATTDVVFPTESGSLQLELTNNGKGAVHIESIGSGIESHPERNSLDLPTKLVKDGVLEPTATRTFPITFKLPNDLALTVPHSEHLYDKYFAGTPFVTVINVEVQQAKFFVQTAKLFDVAPPVEIANVRPNPIVLTSDYAEKSDSQNPLTLTLLNHTSAPFSGTLLTKLNGDVDPLVVKLAAGAREDMTITGRRLLANFHSLPANGGTSLSLTVTLQDATAKGVATRKIPLFVTSAKLTPGLRVAYIRGFDFSLPQALNALGVESKELSVDEVSTSDLSKYTSVIVDNRVYESQPELIGANQKLLDFANAGGTLIVFYHKSDEWNPSPQRNRPQLAPYKLILGNERITDENAPITFTEPDHPLLNTPNKMGQDDFKDWIQERGLYYPREWDPQFHALLQSNDPGEAPLKGGLLVADYGRGHYIYTSMVWYRELRGGVPGAYRMLANMISYGRKLAAEAQRH